MEVPPGGGGIHNSPSARVKNQSGFVAQSEAELKFPGAARGAECGGGDPSGPAERSLHIPSRQSQLVNARVCACARALT